MERLLDKGKVDDYRMYRFQCDCLQSLDAMDIEVESVDGKKFIILSMYFHDSFLKRIKYAYQIIKGRWTYRDFIPRKDDYKYLSIIFNPDKSFKELP